MSRRCRFFTDPRIFNAFTERRLNLVDFFIIFAVAFGTSMFLFDYLNMSLYKDREAMLTQQLAEARAEVRRLKAAAAKRNGTPVSPPASIKGSSETGPMPAAPASDDTVAAISTERVEVVQSGPLKGVPLDVAKEIQEEYRIASIERATRYHEWDQRRRAHHKRDSALVRKELAHGEASHADSKKRREHILSVFSLMSPEQLEVARKEALKTQPVETVDLFFTHIEEFGAAKSVEELNQEAQALAETREALAIAWRALEVEREQLNRERDEINRTKPASPDIDFEEFYTEWKERNRTKPAP